MPATQPSAQQLQEKNIRAYHAFREQSDFLWRESLQYFAQEVFPHHLRLNSPAFHEHVYRELMENIAGPRILITSASPRRGPLKNHQDNMTNHQTPLKVVTTSAASVVSAAHDTTTLGVSGAAADGNGGTPPWGGSSSPFPTAHKISEFSVKSDDIVGVRCLAVAEPRDFGKSTKLMAAVLWSILLGYKRFVIYISKSYEDAVKYLAPMRLELENNKLLRAVYGNQRSAKWTEGEMELNLGAKILARGRGQSIRGLKYMQYRPDLIVLDDIDDENSVASDEIRRKTEQWFDSAVMPAIDPTNGSLINIGTVLHMDSLIAKHVGRDCDKYGNFSPHVYKALNEKEESIWPEKFSTQMLLEEKKRNPYSFAQERMNEPIPIGSGMFKREFFRYFRFVDGKVVCEDSKGKVSWKLSDLNIYLTYDLAVTAKEYSDWTVGAVVGISPDSELFVLEYLRNQYEDPDKIIEDIFALKSKWNPKLVGIESVAFQRWLIINLNKEMKKRNDFLMLTELKADTDKTRRISQLQPRFANGSVFIQNTMGDLETELVTFPVGVHDDIADALAYVLQIMQVPQTHKRQEECSGSFQWWKQQATKARNDEKKKKARQFAMRGLKSWAKNVGESIQ